MLLIMWRLGLIWIEDVCTTTNLCWSQELLAPKATPKWSSQRLANSYYSLKLTQNKGIFGVVSFAIFGVLLTLLTQNLG